jgi:hypothetical protein
VTTALEDQNETVNSTRVHAPVLPKVPRRTKSVR